MTDQADMTVLTHGGLNMVAVFDLAALPVDVRGKLAAAAAPDRFQQVILIAHGGRRFWQALQQAGVGGDDPVDTFTAGLVSDWLAGALPGVEAEILYPLTDSPVPLVELGEFAGWHHASPFRVGINDAFGSWFAYRALVLANSALPVTATATLANPCDGCLDTPCVAACPAGAVGKDGFAASACYDHRLATASSCAASCLARKACPVGRDHAYTSEQMAYHYGRSLASLRQYRKQGLI